MYRLFTFISIIAFVLNVDQLKAQPEIILEPFTTGLNGPVDIANMGDDRLFVLEQRGMIKIISASGEVADTPFLDIRTSVGNTANERGLLGIAFHPDYNENGYFFLHYSDNSGDTRISRFSVMVDDPNQADPDSELIILEIDQPYSNHNGGCIKFGPDGYFYIGMGDGGSAGDPLGAGQDGTLLLAKMLRIDVNNGSPYSIPADNPFIGDTGVKDEIWAMGVRNPWRFSFDSETGDLWIADVGQNQWEEIDFQPADSPGGENYGWNCYEGFEHYDASSCNSAPYTSPIHTYNHSFATGGCSVTGGYVYRGTESPGLIGRYFYTDFCTGFIWTIHNDDGTWVNELLLEGSSNDYATFGENAEGEIFLAGLYSGKIYKIKEKCTSLTLEGMVTNEGCFGAELGAIELELSGPSPWTIDWSNGATDSLINQLAPGEYTVTVTDGENCMKVKSFSIEDDTPNAPSLEIVDEILILTEVFDSYQWYLDGVVLADSTNASLQYTASGEYAVEVTNETGCSVLSNTENVIIEALSYPSGIESVHFIPNPAKKYFNLEIKSTIKMEGNIKIFNTNGHLYKSLYIACDGDFSKHFSIENLPNGLYFVVFNTNKGSFTEKLIKQ